MTASLRPAEASDAEAVAALRFAVAPFQVFTAYALRHTWASTPEENRQLLLVAEAAGEVVGFVRAMLQPTAERSEAAHVLVMVHPDWRRRGIGGRLYRAAESHLRDAGASLIVGRGSGDFPLRRGFTRRNELRFSHLDLTQALPASPQPDGATVRSFREAGPQAAYAVVAATVVDEPGDVPSAALGYSDWFHQTWSNPDYDHDASVVVLAGGVPASYTVVGADRATGRMWSDGTGTLRAYRGRGLAKYAKSVALRRAAASGLRSAYAANDETNQPMIAINEWLGYRPCATQWSYRKEL
jgi:predicted N-acetyltransferase YhbS/RimJ/RimL family protein N-acetyltransferase